jgi:hypothetical protein
MRETTRKEGCASVTRHRILDLAGSCEVCDSPRVELNLYSYTDAPDRILPECAKCGEPLDPSYIDKEDLF